MSTPTTTTTPRQITLTENPDGRWTAYDTATQTVTEGPTRDEALENLDEAVGQPDDQADEQPPEIDPDDPLFSADPIISVSMGDETIDDVLYGAVADADSGADTSDE